MDLEPLPPILVIGIGNPSRGDDALGLLAIARLAEMALPNVGLLTDFQLAPEHSLDLIERELVVFVDATVEGDAAFRLDPVEPKHDDSITSHSLSPEAVLDTFKHVTGLPLPEAFVLAIRGYHFELGAPVSARAEANLDAAMAALLERLRSHALAS